MVLVTVDQTQSRCLPPPQPSPSLLRGAMVSTPAQPTHGQARLPSTLCIPQGFLNANTFLRPDPPCFPKAQASLSSLESLDGFSFSIFSLLVSLASEQLQSLLAACTGSPAGARGMFTGLVPSSAMFIELVPSSTPGNTCSLRYNPHKMHNSYVYNSMVFYIHTLWPSLESRCKTFLAPLIASRMPGRCLRIKPLLGRRPRPDVS